MEKQFAQKVGDGPNARHVQFVLDHEVIDVLDTLVARFSAALPSTKVSKSNLVRAIIRDFADRTPSKLDQETVLAMSWRLKDARKCKPAG